MHQNLPQSIDNRRVALIKSLFTNNRFYVLVAPGSGISNADTVEQVPEGLLLGLTYPCLEDGLNDFAVIRTTFETMDLFGDDDEVRQELLEIINDARGNLLRRLWELHDRMLNRTAYFLGTDLEQFKAHALNLMRRGFLRRNLDSIMKVNVFGSVAATEREEGGNEPIYCYELRYQDHLPRVAALPDRDFVGALFADLIDCVIDDANFDSQYMFDRNIFQKYISLMFVKYATTEATFHGTDEADYGVSQDKDMDHTPLYRAIAREMRRIEAYWVDVQQITSGLTEISGLRPAVQGEPDECDNYPPRLIDSPDVPGPGEAEPASHPDHLRHRGVVSDEGALAGSLTTIHAEAAKLCRHPDEAMVESGRLILAALSRLERELEQLNVTSAPGAAHD